MDLNTLVDIFNNGNSDDIKFIVEGIIPNLSSEEIVNLTTLMYKDGFSQMNHNIGQRTFYWYKWNSNFQTRRVFYQIPKK